MMEKFYKVKKPYVVKNLPFRLVILAATNY